MGLLPSILTTLYGSPSNYLLLLRRFREWLTPLAMRKVRTASEVPSELFLKSVLLTIPTLSCRPASECHRISPISDFIKRKLLFHYRPGDREERDGRGRHWTERNLWSSGDRRKQSDEVCSDRGDCCSFGSCRRSPKKSFSSWFAINPVSSHSQCEYFIGLKTQQHELFRDLSTSGKDVLRTLSQGRLICLLTCESHVTRIKGS